MSGLVAFDLDGTLIDSVSDLATAASRLTEALGGRPLARAEVVAMVGDGAAVLVRRALTAAGLDPELPGALGRFVAIYDQCLFDTTRVYDGIVAALDALDPVVPLAVVTNKPLAPTRTLLDAFGLAPRFVDVVGGDGPWPRKPDPAGLLSLRGYARGGPLVLVGDSPVDAETADRAGAAFVLASYGFGAAKFVGAPDTPWVATTPADLPGLIADALRLGRSTA